jgi:hypothetical protein
VAKIYDHLVIGDTKSTERMSEAVVKYSLLIYKIPEKSKD